MAFGPGDAVHVAAFGKGLVREVRNGGRYLVEVKGRAMVVGAGQLTGLVPRKHAAAADPAPPAGEMPERLRRTGAASTIDLHGMTTVEAVAALDGFIDDALRAGHAEVAVIHGRSGGRVKGAVHLRLKGLAVRAFRLDPSNPGVTLVTL